MNPAPSFNSFLCNNVGKGAEWIAENYNDKETNKEGAG